MDPNRGYCHSSSSHQSHHSHHQQSHLQIGSSSSSSTSSASSSQQQQQQQQQQHHHQQQSQYGNELIPTKSNNNRDNRDNNNSNSNHHHNNKTHLNSTTAGNYINVVPVPIGVQYHRRKLTPQDYQPRLYYNSSDYRCREDFYSIGSATGTIASSSQQQQQHQQQQQQIDVVDQALINSRVVATQTNNNNNNNNNSNNSNCNFSSNNSCDQQIISAVNNNGNGNNNISSNNGGCGTPVQPPVLYTVHRVVTTAQIQTAGGNTFATSSSVSSVVSAVRSEVDCNLLQQQQQPTPGTSGLQIQGATSSSGLNNSPGISTNSNYQQQQQQQQQQPSTSCNQDVQPSSNLSNNYNSSTASTSSNYSSGAKSSTSIPRPLQNVIPTCVYLMSRIAVHMEIEGTAQCPAQVMLAAALGCEELGIANKLLAQSIFGLWMTSALLEIQLKSHHRPYVVRVAWPHLLEKFSHGNPIEKRFDEPMIVLKRNVFFSKKDEEKIKDHRIIELLYEEAKHNVLEGRYIMEPVHSIMLGGIQARIELGPYNSHTHTNSYFRENQSRFLPQHVAKNSSWSWFPLSRKNSAEVKLLEQFKRVPQTTTTRKLMRKYLEFCWALPFYGAAFFHGQVEQPVRGLMSLVNHKDISVIVAINERGVFIIEPVECTLLLGLRYEDLSWDYAKPSSSDDPDCQTCIFLQFDAVENGIPVSKLMQIFSRQAAMMDALIAHFADQMRRRREAADGQPGEHVHDEPNPIQNNGNGVLCNKLSRLTLATFDDEGRCIGQMGSLSISY